MVESTACPDLAILDAVERGAAIIEHAAACMTCRMVLELLEERKRGLADRDRRAECDRFELLLAAREEGTIGGSAGTLLDEHLRSCPDCAVVAATIAPSDRPATVASLPAVSTSAYALGREVARGGMGRILAAQDLRIGRPVAVKELLGKSPSLAARFEREARVTARLQHPGIVPIYEIGKWPDGTPFYTMRMVEGRTLRDALRDKPTLDARLELLSAVIAAAEAVAFAHDKRIIHRDLTPNNILVGAYGDTVVIDWGLAKDLSDPIEDDVAAGPYRDESTAEGLTNVGAVIGTAAYMPPEQARGEPVDQRADVYAIGAILYHLLASEPPYVANKSDDLLRQVQANAPRSISDVAPGAPRDLISIVDKAMARDSADRYANAGEIAADLRRFQTGRVVEAHEYSRGERVRRWMRARRAGVLASVASMIVLAVAGSVGVVSVLRERDTAEAEAREADRQRTAAQRSSTALLEELGRQELLGGNPARAAALLAEAYATGGSSVSLRFLLGSAMRNVEAVERTLTGDPRPVTNLTQTPDGSRLIVAHQFVAEQWTSSGARLASLSDQGGDLGIAIYSADGNWVLTYAGDSFVRAWDARSGQLVQKVEVKDAVIAMIGDDGSQFLTLGSDGSARRWDSKTGTVRETIQIRLLPIDREMNTESGYFIAVQNDGRLAIWDWEHDSHPVAVDRGWRPVPRREVNRDGTRFVLCENTETQLWDGTRKLLRTFHTTRPSVMCSLDDSGARVLTSDTVGNATIWDAATGEVRAEASLGDGPTGAIFVGGRLVAMSPFSTLIQVRDADTGTALSTYPRQPGPLMLGLVGRAADRRLALPRADGSVDLIELNSDRLLNRFVRRDHPMDKVAIVVGDRLVTRNSQTSTLWNVQTGTSLATSGWPAALNQAGTRMAAAREDGTVVVLDTINGAQLAAVSVGTSLISVDLDRDGRHLVACQRGLPCGVWDTRTGRKIASTSVIQDNGWASLSPDGRSVIEFHQFGLGTLQLLERRESRNVGHKMTGYVFSDRSSVIAVGHQPDNANIISVLDIATGTRLLEVPAHTISFDRSGSLAATGGDSGVQLWSLSTGKLQLEIDAATTPLAWGVALSPDGALVQTAAGVWSATDGRKLAEFVVAGQSPHASTGVNGEATTGWDLGYSSMSSTGEFGATYSDNLDVTLWDLRLESRPPAKIKQIVDARVPWRVVDGRLVPSPSAGPAGATP